MTTVKVASDNHVKVEAIKTAFERYFVEVEAIPYKVNSGVPEQPLNDHVFKGAENRLTELREICGDYEYMASCESGLICKAGHWFNIQVVMVQNSEGKSGLGVSAGYEVPMDYLEEILATDMADFLHKKFNGKGGTRVLTKNQFTRKDLIRDATIMALVSVLNGDIW